MLVLLAVGWRRDTQKQPRNLYKELLSVVFWLSFDKGAFVLRKSPNAINKDKMIVSSRQPHSNSSRNRKSLEISKFSLFKLVPEPALNYLACFLRFDVTV